MNLLQKLTIINLLLFIWIFPVFGQIELEIWQVQGEEEASIYEDQDVRLSNNIITAVTDNLIILQTPDDRSDDNPLTSDAILVVSNGTHTFDIGDEISLEGEVAELDGATGILVNLSDISLQSSNNSLPAAFVLDEQFPATSITPFPNYERLENMRVAFQDLKIYAPSYENGTCYVSPTSTRPFREAGIAYPGRDELPVWDTNPELLIFAPDFFGLADNDELGVGMTLSGSAILAETNIGFGLLPTSYVINGDFISTSVRDKETQEATLGCLNALFLDSGEFNYNFRLEKLARYVIEKMKSPDIIAFQEIRELDVLPDLAKELLEMDETANYTAHIKDAGSGFLYNGYLVKNTVSNISVTPLGESESLSISGRTHDRPPLLLEATLNTEPPTPINVINVHIRSLNGIENSQESNFVRTKRHEQAISIANMVKALQAQNKAVFIVGDFNAFQFSDGYVDVINQITGQASEGALFPVEPILDEPLVNYTTLAVPIEEQYSYVFQGSAQILDHCLGSTNFEGMTVDELQFIRGNADAPEVFFEEDSRLRVSDHDGFVVFIDLEDELDTMTSNLPITNDEIFFPNPLRLEDQIFFNLEEKQNLSFRLMDISGRVINEGTFESLDEAIEPFPFPETSALQTGVYVIQFFGKSKEWIKKVMLVN